MNQPLVSICVPVKNGERHINKQKINIEKVLNSLVNQTYKNIEIIISDNCSNDATYEIIKNFEKKYNFVNVYRHENEVSWAENFEFTLNKARGDYLKWNACDDIVSLDFIENNVEFLEHNLDYSYSASKSYYEMSLNNSINIKLDGTLYERIKNFFKVRTVCHSVFYSLIRTKFLRRSTKISNDFLGIDWIICLDLLFFGKFKTIDEGYMVFGTNGMSRQNNFLNRKNYSKKFIYKILPFFELNKILISKSILSNKLNLFQKINILIINLKLNIHFLLKYMLRLCSKKI